MAMEAQTGPAVWIDDRAGRRWTVEVGSRFVIGRSGDLAFDDNPYLHRQLVRFSYHDGFWWVSNVGGRIPVKIIDEETGIPATLPHGTSTILVSRSILLVFEAGPTVYEIAAGLSVAPRPPEVDDEDLVVADEGTGETAGPGSLNVEQMQLLVAMAEPLLRYPGKGLNEIPTIQAVAARLGWSTAKANRKLDYLCQRLAEGGVSGLVPDFRGNQAVNRRTRLIEYALDARVISQESLVLLEGVTGPAAGRVD